MNCVGVKGPTLNVDSIILWAESHNWIKTRKLRTSVHLLPYLWMQGDQMPAIMTFLPS